MKVVYALEDLPDTISKSIFLAGPTPRSADGNPWRQEALKLLEEKNYDGVVFIPEPRDAKWHREYDRQVAWEELCLNVADCVLFWIPRDLKTMPAFTTNIEWGRWENSSKLVLGYPPEAEKMSYIAYYAKQEQIPVADTLSDTLDLALKMVEKEAVRSGGERYIPLHIWNTPQFQTWYATQRNVGNYIDSAKVLFTYHHIPREYGVFFFILRSHVYVAAENRIKTLDFTLARTDISSVLLWKRSENVEDSEVVLVREYRPSVSNEIGFIVELPSGSSADIAESDPWDLAVQEVHEETGFLIESSRLKSHGARQLLSPLSAHKSHLFSVEITQEELDWFKSQAGIVHGNVDSGERTYIEVKKLSNLWEKDTLDWSTLGQILTVVYSK